MKNSTVPDGYIVNGKFDELNKLFRDLLKECDHFYLYSYTKFYERKHKFKKIILNDNFVQNDLYEGIWLDCDAAINNGVLSYKEIVPFKRTAFIKCFTETYDDLSMWGMYGDNGYGICTEYDLKQLSDEAALKKLFPIVYSKKPLAFIAWDVMSGEDECFIEDAEKDYCWYYNKCDKWERENEWRIVTFDEKESEIDFDCISKIYCGPKMTQECKVCLSALIKMKFPDREIKLVDTFMRRDGYGIYVNK